MILNTTRMTRYGDRGRVTAALAAAAFALTALLDRPLLLIGVGLFALVAWGVVTFAAVRLAIVSAHKATRAAVS
jgi:hypothetical protein